MCARGNTKNTKRRREANITLRVSVMYAYDVCLMLLITAVYQKFHVIGFAIAPPSWSDPKVNPCAKTANGWQHLYYPPLKDCFKIFTLGYPCPQSMELSPILNGVTGHGECKCPPGTAQLNTTSTCYKIFDRGPCDSGQYLNPLPQEKGVKTSFRLGECKKLKQCPTGKVHWPEKDACYELFSRGPCVNGKLLSFDENSIPKCQCLNSGSLAKFYNRETKTCHQHFTQGVCPQGKLFLPSQACGCNSSLPHFYNSTGQCYEIGSSGPCPNHGYEFTVIENDQHASCKCKNGYVLMQDGLCYRLYTKGPCTEGQVVSDTKTCITNPCQKNFLYFPHEQTCYRIGSQGPCRTEQVVVFDFTVKVGLDGVSYNGMCGCSGIIKNLDQSCLKNDDSPKTLCDSPLVEFKGGCYQLYSKGPCQVGQWLEPSKHHNTSKAAKCQCKPGYVPYDKVETEYGVTGCHGPSVLLARFLNGNKTYRFGFQRWNHVEVAV